MMRATRYRQELIEHVYALESTRWRTVKAWRIDPAAVNGSRTWWAAVTVDVDVDVVGVNAFVMLRARSTDGSVSNVATVSTSTERLQLGFFEIPTSAQTIVLEAIRPSGPTGVARFNRAELLPTASVPDSQKGGPFAPGGYVHTMKWSFTAPPAGGFWPDSHTGTEPLTITGGPTITADTVELRTGDQITGPAIPTPDDTFEVRVDVTTPAVPQAGDRILFTKADNTNGTEGIDLRWNNTTGDVVFRAVDTPGTFLFAPVAPLTLGARITLTVRQTPTEWVVEQDGVAVTTLARPNPTSGNNGATFIVNGVPGGANTGNLDIHGVDILGTALVAPAAGAAASGAPPAALIPTGQLVVDINAANTASWGNLRGALDGQWIIAGNRFNPGANDNSGGVGTGYGLAWEADNTTINGAFTAQDGELRRLWLDTHNGVDVVHTSTQFVSDGSYVYQPGAQNTAINIPPSDPLYFDGTRNQLAIIGKALSVGPGTDPIKVMFSFVVEPWMQGNDYTTGPHELHEPGSLKSSPMLFSLRNGQIGANAKYSPTPLAVNAPNPSGSVDLHDHTLPAAGTIVTFICEYRIDPGGTGFFDWYEVDGTGTPQTLVTFGPNFGWIFDTGSTGYVNQNNEFYPIAMQTYNFHQFTPSPPDNWDNTSSDGNVRRLRTPFFVMTQDPTVTINDLAGHARVYLGI